MPTWGKAAANTALPQPPSTSQNVPNIRPHIASRDSSRTPSLDLDARWMSVGKADVPDHKCLPKSAAIRSLERASRVPRGVANPLYSRTAIGQLEALSHKGV